MVLERSVSEDRGRAKPARADPGVISQRLRSEAAAAAQNKTISKSGPAKERWETAAGARAKGPQAAPEPTHERIIGTSDNSLLPPGLALLAVHQMLAPAALRSCRNSLMPRLSASSASRISPT